MFLTLTYNILLTGRSDHHYCSYIYIVDHYFRFALVGDMTFIINKQRLILFLFDTVLRKVQPSHRSYL